jgi:hypothetical protein
MWDGVTYFRDNNNALHAKALPLALRLFFPLGPQGVDLIRQHHQLPPQLGLVVHLLRHVRAQPLQLHNDVCFLRLPCE